MNGRSAESLRAVLCTHRSTVTKPPVGADYVAIPLVFA